MAEDEVVMTHHEVVMTHHEVVMAEDEVVMADHGVVMESSHPHAASRAGRASMTSKSWRTTTQSRTHGPLPGWPTMWAWWMTRDALSWPVEHGRSNRQDGFPGPDLSDTVADDSDA